MEYLGLLVMGILLVHARHRQHHGQYQHDTRVEP